MRTHLQGSARKGKGFTLIEVLVVVFIIAVLAALAIPISRKGIVAANRAAAVMQIRQVSALAVSYAMENNGILPEEGGEGVQSFKKLSEQPLAWYNVLPALSGSRTGTDYRAFPDQFYGNGSFFLIKSAAYPKDKTNKAYFAFAINSQLVSPSRPKMRLTNISEPVRTPLFAEAALPDEIKLLPTGGSTSDLGQPKVRDKRFVGRYNGTGVIGFADGHSEVVAVNKANASSKPAVFWEVP